MSDLETRLRALLTEKAGDMSAASPASLPARDRRAMRRRQAASGVAVVMLAAILGVGSVAGASLLRRDGQPGGEPAPRSTGRIVSSGLELGSGSTAGAQWVLTLQRQPDSLCLLLQVTSADRRVSADAGPCDQGPEEQRLSPAAHSGLTVESWTFRTPEGSTTFVMGGASRDIDRVEIRLDDQAVVEATLVRPPDFLTVGFDLYFAVLEGERSGEAVGTADGKDAVHEDFRPFRLNRLPGDLTACGDNFGNVVGYLGTGEGGELLGTWQAPGSTDIGAAKIRKIARSPLQNVWSRVASWWDARPDPGATDVAYLGWWADYPIKQ